MTSPILKYYKGKHLEGAKFALELLAKADALGYWPKGYSRKVKSTLNKTNRALTAPASNGARAYKFGDSIAVDYGCFERAPKMLAKIIEIPPWDTAASAMYRMWCEDFAPVAELVAKLDATRPKPAYVIGTISPTVFANVCAQTGMNLKIETVRMPEIVWVKKTELLQGREVTVWIGIVKWPENTLHHKSKFAFGTEHNDQCNACGHAIKNPHNWVPLLVDGLDGVPRSLWTGKDCAENFFGCQVKNPAAFTDNPGFVK